MKRRLLTIFSALSLLLTAALAFLWLRSHHTHHALLHPALGHTWQISSLHGTLCLILHRDTDVAPISRFDSYAISSDGIERERRFAFDRHTGTRYAREIAEARYEADNARRLAYANSQFHPPPDPSHLEAARHGLANAIVEESRYFARSRATDAVVKARDHLGFHYHPADNTAGTILTIPYWSLLALTAAIPCIHLLLHRRARRRGRQGHCPACGYDVRATPHQCPECGAITTKP